MDRIIGVCTTIEPDSLKQQGISLQSLLVYRTEKEVFKIIKVIAILVLIIGLVGGVYLAQHPQILKSKASETDADGNLIPPPAPSYSLQKGFAMDVNTPEQIPSDKVYRLLNPQWVRFVYHADKGIPASIPNNVKILIVFNSEATPELTNIVPPSSSINFNKTWFNGYQLPKEDYQMWKKFTDEHYIPALNTFLKTNQRVDAIEVMNEQDLCTGRCIVPEAYAYLLKSASQTIRRYNRNIKVVIGGLVAAEDQYLDLMKNEDKDIFSYADGLGIHPYGQSPYGWCGCGSDEQCTKAPECGAHNLSSDRLEWWMDHWRNKADNLPIWVTEVGLTDWEPNDGGSTTESQSWQGEYLKRIYQVFSDKQVYMAVWYAWSDNVTGWTPEGSRTSKFGLVDSQGSIKASGIEFRRVDKK